MDSMQAKSAGDLLESPKKPPPELKPQTSDQINASQLAIRTPQKLSSLPRRFKYHRHSQLPDKYEMMLKFFDALVAALKLLRLRKSIPVFSKIRVMIETMSERRFTHQHLSQLKFLLPEMGVKRILLPDDEMRNMKYDLHLTLNVSMMIDAKKRKRGTKRSSLRNCFISRLLQFLRDHPEGTEIPEEELPAPFNCRKQGPILSNMELASSSSHVQKGSYATEELQPARSSHFPASFKKHFSKGHLQSESGIILRGLSESSPQSPSVSVLKPPRNKDELNYATVESKQGLSEDDESFSTQTANVKCTTPIKSSGTPRNLMPNTPAMQTLERRRMTSDDNSATTLKQQGSRPSCARSLQFDCAPKNVNIELQVDDTESSTILYILPANLLQTLKEKEKEQAKRKLMIARLPKLFDRIYYLFQSPKSPAISKEALIHDLTESHSDITDQSEVELQLQILQETIPDWISPKSSPSGKIIYSINKALDPNTLRLRLDNAK